MEHIISRVGFCEECAKNQFPKTGQKFLAYGHTHRRFIVMETERYGKLGFTPHIYKGNIVGENVIVHKSCALYPCGCYKKWDRLGFDFYTMREYKREIWTIAAWNALILFKNDKDYRV